MNRFIIILCLVLISFEMRGHNELGSSEEDALERIRLLEQSANAGNSENQRILGTLYLNGEVLEQDTTKAVLWLAKAGEAGDTVAQGMLGTCYFNGDYLNLDLDKAEYWFSKLAVLGSKRAQRLLSFGFYEGFGFPRNLEKSFYWLSYLPDDPDAIYYLSKFYEQGYVVDKNPVKAFELVKKAADMGCETALTTLGFYYARGIGTLMDDEKAYECFSKAYKNGDADGVASSALGLFYEYGRVVKRNIPKAMQMYKESAEKGNELAMDAYNKLYMMGYRPDKTKKGKKSRKSEKSTFDYEPYN